ncbi:NAD(P)/FAD-dependent oxidoreductase [Croceitalea rosinachiae]|uniref:FAD-dependent oxidoreductase n=1 Tax=Croceitalea rosinachiae TaxID=3075596 RepID=A0ABU3A9B8_9FLAO|nr:FAD-dependent oxidoreductase [Croceitalea sp. F388]MDT0606789.1 FAD-dependent oxidoreductase [Croceitalea sp. F388]
MLDYLVVGLGLAGISFCEQLEKHGKTFRAISDNSQRASIVAGGLYNPVILKRFTMAWNARVQIDVSMPFYASLEHKLKVKLDYKLPVLRRFASIEEQNLWFEAADKADLDYFLSTSIRENQNSNIEAPFGYGKVNYTGRIDTRVLIESYKDYLLKKSRLQEEQFDFEQFEISNSHVAYKKIKARQIIFSEGYGLKSNPYFEYLPLNGTKGELLTIKAPELQETAVIKSSVFIIPLGSDLYRIGATYKWKDKTNIPTEASKQELLEKLGTFLRCDYEVVSHVAGVRPTVTDRRPLVGQHPKYKNIYVLNGFGSRGVLIAPAASQNLFEHIEGGEAIDPDMDISRFTAKYYVV